VSQIVRDGDGIDGSHVGAVWVSAFGG
jgi:hypothetical protein